MIPAGARSYIADQVVVDGLTVLPFGVVGPFQPPVLVFGQPDVEFGDWGCSHKVTIGLAVVVRHHPQGPEATIRDLDQLWPQVVRQLLDLTSSDPTLGGFVHNSKLTEASFGDFVVAGTVYPAQNLTLETYLS